MKKLQRFRKPISLLGGEQREGGGGILLVPFARVLCLVEELNVWRDDGNLLRRCEDHLRDRAADASIAAADKDAVCSAIIEKEFNFLAAGFIERLELEKRQLDSFVVPGHPRMIDGLVPS